MTVYADAFADALDGTATDLLEDTERMLGVVERLHGLPGTAALSNAGARPDFRSELRARLLEQAAAPLLVDDPHAKVVPITSRWNQSWARRNRARLLTSAAAGVIIVTAVSVGASNSLPGNPLYPVKRGGESLEYALAGSDEARGKLELSFARTRLDEIGRLTSHDAAFGIAPVTGIQAAGGSTVLATSTNTWVVRLFGDMDGNAAKGSALLQQSFKDNPRPAPLREVQEFALFQEAKLKVLKGRLAGSALSKATSSLIWATAAVKKMTAALTTCKGNTCPANAGAALSSLATPPPSAAPPSATPSTSPSLSPSTSPSVAPSLLAPSVAPSLPALVPPPSTAPTTPPATVAPPQVTPTAPVAVPPTTPAPPTTSAPPTSTSPSPSDTPTSPTTTELSPSATPSLPPTTTTAPPTPSTTEPPSADPTTLVPVPPTSPAVPTTEPVVPTTPAPTTTVPVVVPTTPAAPTTDPVTTTPPPPTTTPAAPTTTPAPPTTTPAPPTTTPAPPTTTPPTSHPILICLPGAHIIGGICIRVGPPGRL